MIKDTAVWYLAHPVAPDDRFTYEQNLEHTLHMMKLCWEEGFRVYAPWHTLCLFMPDANPDYRRMGLEVDVQLAKMTGRLILTGHRISSGMQKELDAVRELESYFIIDCTNRDDEAVRAGLRACQEDIQNYY